MFKIKIKNPKIYFTIINLHSTQVQLFSYFLNLSLGGNPVLSLPGECELTFVFAVIGAGAAVQWGLAVPNQTYMQRDKAYEFGIWTLVHELWTSSMGLWTGDDSGLYQLDHSLSLRLLKSFFSLIMLYLNRVDFPMFSLLLST